MAFSPLELLNHQPIRGTLASKQFFRELTLSHKELASAACHQAGRLKRATTSTKPPYQYSDADADPEQRQDLSQTPPTAIASDATPRWRNGGGIPSQSTHAVCHLKG